MKNALFYLRQALSSFTTRPGTYLLTVGTVSLALILAGTLFLVSEVLKYASETWGNGAQVAVYLEQGVSTERVQEIRARIATLPGVHSISTISSAKARKRLLTSLKRDAHLVQEVEAAFFPLSLEVVIRGESATVLKTRKTIAKLNGIVKGINDVRSVHTWNRKIGYIIDVMVLIAFVILTLVLFASGYVIMSTMRLLVESRLEEMRVVKFLGASPAFLHAPLLLNGALLGVISAVVAFGALYGLAHFTFPFITAVVGSTLPGTDTLVFFTPQQLAMGVGIALLTGLFGGKLALSTLKV